LQTGYQLSFAATWALFHFGEASQKLARRWHCGEGWKAGLFHTLFLSSAVSLTLHPLLSHCTQVTSPLSPLANLPALPLGSAMLVSALLCLIAAPLDLLAVWVPETLPIAFVTFPAQAFGMAASAFAIGLEAVVKACAGVPGAVVPNPAIPLPTLLLWGIGLACAPHVFSHRLSRKGAWLVSVLAAFQFCVHSWQSHRHPEITLVFLAVGHGDAALLRVPGADFLIDAGPSHGIARQRLIPALRALGVHSLKGALITHGDADHVAGLSGLLGQVRIESLGISKGMDGSRPFNRCLERAEAMGIPLQNLEEGDVLYRGPSGQIKVLSPGQQEMARRTAVKYVAFLKIFQRNAPSVRSLQGASKGAT
jgi:hypothetical protein